MLKIKVFKTGKVFYQKIHNFLWQQNLADFEKLNFSFSFQVSHLKLVTDKKQRTGAC